MEKNATKKKSATREKCKASQSGNQNKTPAKHYFAGANTGKGFYNLFGQINDPEQSGLLYILKGGPGTGKSTLMKTVGKTFYEMGCDIEYFYCSSDYGSLDGVRLNEHNIAIVDGTAPHVTEATMPAIREKIINIGEFIGGGISKHEKEISALIKKKKLQFDAAYLYLRNAENLYECNKLIYESQNDKTNIKSAAKKIIAQLNLEKVAKLGKLRKLFLKAVAGDGTVDFTNLNKFSEIITLPYNSFINNKILGAVSKSVADMGYDVTCFLEILSTDSINAVYIPARNTLITQKPACADNKKPNKYTEYNDEAIRLSQRQAANAITDAKKLHKKIEAYYIPCMDFASISEMTENLISEIKKTIG